ncbi:MAG: hypothetical protein O2955_06735 [Planctomycetota bacterium]|nr:hypothetical protein [Planctomycetota bacterium]MDA1212191.1 hypothetical protein [Planctomycetota bacterium]
MISSHSPSETGTPQPSPRGTSGVSWRSVIAALPDIALAGAFLITWISPYTFGDTAVRYFMLTMLLEFIIVHSSAFMGNVIFSRGSKSGRVIALVGLGLFYSLFVGGFAIGFGEWWPIYAFWGLTFNRMLGVIIGDAVEGQESLYVRAGWALSAIYYLAGAFLTTLLPLPSLGITPPVRDTLDLPGDGLWIDEPYRVLAFGFLYFALTAVGELRGWAKNEQFLKGVPRENE